MKICLSIHIVELFAKQLNNRNSRNVVTSLIKEHFKIETLTFRLSKTGYIMRYVWFHQQLYWMPDQWFSGTQIETRMLLEHNLLWRKSKCRQHCKCLQFCCTWFFLLIGIISEFFQNYEIIAFSSSSRFQIDIKL